MADIALVRGDQHRLGGIRVEIEKVEIAVCKTVQLLQYQPAPVPTHGPEIETIIVLVDQLPGIVRACIAIEVEGLGVALIGLQVEGLAV